MSFDRSPEAERLLMRIRASADPAPGVDRRVLTGVEQRLALQAAARAGGEVSNRAALASTPASRWGGASHVAARLGRWGAFGILAGAIGYHLGSTARDRAEAPVAAVSVAAPAAGSTDATRRVAAVAASTDAPPASASSMAAASSAAASSAAASSAAASSAAASSAAASSAAASSAAVSAKSRAVPRRASRATLQKLAEPSQELDLAAVLERVLRAQASLRDGDPHAALAQLDALDAADHSRSGLLIDERLVVRALAFCDIGRVGDARRVLSELDGRGAESIYRGRLTQSCSAALER
jgi:hypothetical protein